MLKVDCCFFPFSRIWGLCCILSNLHVIFLIACIYLLISVHQYELEHEKLATELEEERKSHKERDQWIREQQMKIDNLSSLVTLSDCDRKSSQVEQCNTNVNFWTFCHGLFFFRWWLKFLLCSHSDCLMLCQQNSANIHFLNIWLPLNLVKPYPNC